MYSAFEYTLAVVFFALGMLPIPFDPVLLSLPLHLSIGTVLRVTLVFMGRRDYFRRSYVEFLMCFMHVYNPLFSRPKLIALL